jgi:hypothetical protein
VDTTRTRVICIACGHTRIVEGHFNEHVELVCPKHGELVRVDYGGRLSGRWYRRSGRRVATIRGHPRPHQ